MAIPTILQQLNQRTNIPTIQNNLAQLKSMIGMIKNANNPQALLDNMITQNPQVKQAMDYVNAHGGDPKRAFEELARERGINPDDIHKIIQG
jgi:hypothetical protein